MIEREDIIQAVREALEGRDELFCVGVKVRGDEVEVFIDSDGRVTIDDCAALTRAVEGRFDREADDFSLTVSSAGIGQPLTVLRQYRKMVGREVEVVTLGGRKFTATLDAVQAGPEDANNANAENGAGFGAEELKGASVTLSYPEKQKVEGEKRPRVVTVTKTVPLAELKSVCEHIDFK